MNDEFTYKEFRIDGDGQTVFFDYQIVHGNDTYLLTETLRFPSALKDNERQQACLRALHIALGVSYYKIFMSPRIRHPYAMNADEASFWNDVWRHGLGEFLYINKLDPANLAQFSAQDGATITHEPTHADSNEDSALLGIGGGKDSIVAGETLKAIGLKLQGFVMATGKQLGQAKAVADTMCIPLLVVERTIDKQLLSLQQQPGAFRGHVPISLIFGLVGANIAVATNAAYIAVGNEASASIPRINWQHGAVNHQWSKSFAFEVALQEFIRSRTDVTYFSAIRPLTSVAVAKLFAPLRQYFEVFTSDNSVFRIDPSQRPNARWSLESPKSLSSFILLAPWLSEADLLTIFGRNFLDEPSLETLFWELIGQQGEPPLDCVGTTEELILSLAIAHSQGKFSDSHLMRLAIKRGVISEQNWPKQLNATLTLQDQHAFPPKLTEPIISRLREGLAS